MTAEEFVRQVMEELRVESPAALADALGWPRGKERTVARWLAGETKPSYMNVIEMVERAGLLSKGEGGRAVPVAPGDPLIALEAVVDRMADRTAAALEKLQKEVTELSARIPPAAGRRRKSG